MQSRSPRLPGRLAAPVIALALVLSPAAVLAQSPAASPATPMGPVTVTDADGDPIEIADSSRVVTLGGVITETAYALGAGDQVVGVDASSTYPQDVLAVGALIPY